jgi:hypothetical protein
MLVRQVRPESRLLKSCLALVSSSQVGYLDSGLLGLFRFPVSAVISLWEVWAQRDGCLSDNSGFSVVLLLLGQNEKLLQCAIKENRRVFIHGARGTRSACDYAEVSPTSGSRNGVRVVGGNMR